MTRRSYFRGFCAPRGRHSLKPAAGQVVARRSASFLLHLGPYRYVNVANHGTLIEEILTWDISTGYHLINISSF